MKKVLIFIAALLFITLLLPLAVVYIMKGFM